MADIPDIQTFEQPKTEENQNIDYVILVLAILGIFFGGIGLVFSIPAIILGVREQKKRNTGFLKGVVIVAWIALAIGIVGAILGLLVLSSLFAAGF